MQRFGDGCEFILCDLIKSLLQLAPELVRIIQYLTRIVRVGEMVTSLSIVVIIKTVQNVHGDIKQGDEVFLRRH